MQAVEFITKAKNGLIKIPEEYHKDLHGELRVIVLVSAKSKKKTLTAVKIKTKGLKFDREAANER